MARRPKTTTDHLAQALAEAERIGLALDQIDLRTLTPALRKTLKQCRSAQQEMVSQVSEAIHQEAPELPQQIKRKAPTRKP